MKNEKKGLLISIEGTDGSGKETQAKLLFNYLKKKKKKVKIISFPRHKTKSARLVDQYLEGLFGNKAEEVPAKVTSGLYAYDRYMAKPSILRLLKKGFIVILDRYVSANKGHQLGKIKDNKKRKEFLNWLNNLEYKINAVPKPDITFFLHLPTGYNIININKTFKKTGVKKDIHEKDIKHIKSSEDAFLWSVKNDKAENWIKINCLNKDKKRYTPLEINKKILKEIDKLF